MAKRKKTDIVQFKVRLREALRKQLEAAAHAKDISLNSEMVSRLETSFVQASLDDQIAAMGAIQKQTVRLLKVAEKAAGILDRESTKLDQESALLEEIQKTEAQLRKLEDAAWGKQPDLSLSDVPDKKEIQRILRAALGREPTDNELRAAARIKAERELPPDQKPGLPLSPRAAAETNEERQARLRALADDLLKNAERSDARSAHDAGQREWDTRSVPPRSLSDQEPELPMPHQKGGKS